MAKHMFFRKYDEAIMAHSPPLPVNSALDAIGNTPVVRLNRVVPSRHAEVFVKLEYFNPTGSYKDRMARTLIEEAERRGAVEPGKTGIRERGGGTACSLCFVFQANTHHLR